VDMGMRVNEARRRGRVGALVGGIAAMTALVGASHATAALTVQDLEHGATADGLAQALAGQGVTISNVVQTGAPRSAGTFGGGDGIVGFGGGVVLGSGKVQTVAGDAPCSRGVEGPNQCYEDAGSGGGPEGVSNSTVFDTPGDAQLTELSQAFGGGQTFDASILEFDFVPSGTQVTFNYVFSSDEYSDFSNTSVNDVFGFFVNNANCATVPGTNEPVTVNTINNGNDVGGDPTPHNPQFFIDNVRPNPTLDTEMDGLTTVFTCTAAVNAGQTNHMKLAVADAGDDIFDAGVFIQAGSLTSPPSSGLVLDVRGRKNQKIIGPQVKPAGKAKNNAGKVLSVKVTCENSPCNTTVKGTVKVGGAKLKLDSKKVSLQANETARVRLSASKNQVARLKGDLKDGERGKATITGKATAPNGDIDSDRFKVKLRGR
jgi:hypothetical protein